MTENPAPKRGRPTAEERLLRHQRILDSAVAQFAARGLARSSLDEIAAGAGVTKRTLYADYGDKQAIFAAAVSREHDRLREAAAHPVTLLALCTEIVHVLHADTAVALHRAVLTEAAHAPQLAAEFYDAGPRHSIDLLSSFAQDARPAQVRALYSLLLGDTHRRRLLGLDGAPDRAEAGRQAGEALTLLGFSPGDGR
ncbi:TetR/AcrR family transcriptional regulator [Herbiconiux sp. A18JL235]|uniref:TetR/AcrR family transcriptional regulator n=1 Tax=Herbiconiux sp. A18JL235 TaxID=3152363 RepID=A0AB39BI32_9MICO